MGFIPRHSHPGLFPGGGSSLDFIWVGEYGIFKSPVRKHLAVSAYFLAWGIICPIFQLVGGFDLELAALGEVPGPDSWSYSSGIWDGLFLPSGHVLDQEILSRFGTLGLGCEWKHFSDCLGLNGGPFLAIWIFDGPFLWGDYIFRCLDHQPGANLLVFAC